MKCLFCGNDFSTEGQRNPTHMKYCSSNCRNLFYYYDGKKPLQRRTLKIAEPRICLECGKEFTPIASHALAQRCSKECNSVHQHRELSDKRRLTMLEKLSIPKVCSVCSKEYLPNHVQQNFCSDECKGIGALEKAKKYTKTLDPGVKTNRNRKRRLDGNWYTVMERAEYKCQLCGNTENIRVHHLDGVRERKDGKKQGNNDINNLMVLCEQCHKDIHGIFLVLKDGEWVIKGKIFDKLKLQGSIKVHQHTHSC